MKVFVLASVLALAAATTLDSQWEDFKQRHNKIYDQEEEVMRKKVFSSNLEFIMKHNAAAANGEHTYTVGLNKYADLTNEEFRAILNGFKPEMMKPSENQFEPSGVEDLPASVDWNKKGWVTPIKDQGQCGSCWAFSATGSIEGQHFNATGKLVSISEQQLLDCDTIDDSCNGGLMDNAFTYIIQNKGDDTEASYPYQAREGAKCLFKSADVGATISSFIDVPSGDEKALTQAIADVGPISVAIDASQLSFQLYTSGVYYEPNCGNTRYDLDHGVLAYGYGTSSDGKDYYMVKNSWGTTWGNEGFILMSRNRDNNCGIATAASYPVV